MENSNDTSVADHESNRSDPRVGDQDEAEELCPKNHHIMNESKNTHIHDHDMNDGRNNDDHGDNGDVSFDETGIKICTDVDQLSDISHSSRSTSSSSMHSTGYDHGNTIEEQTRIKSDMNSKMGTKASSSSTENTLLEASTVLLSSPNKVPSTASNASNDLTPSSASKSPSRRQNPTATVGGAGRGLHPYLLHQRQAPGQSAYSAASSLSSRRTSDRNEHRDRHSGHGYGANYFYHRHSNHQRFPSSSSQNRGCHNSDGRSSDPKSSEESGENDMKVKNWLRLRPHESKSSSHSLVYVARNRAYGSNMNYHYAPTYLNPDQTTTTTAVSTGTAGATRGAGHHQYHEHAPSSAFQSYSMQMHPNIQQQQHYSEGSFNMNYHHDHHAQYHPSHYPPQSFPQNSHNQHHRHHFPQARGPVQMPFVNEDSSSLDLSNYTENQINQHPVVTSSENCDNDSKDVLDEDGMTQDDGTNILNDGDVSKDNSKESGEGPNESVHRRYSDGTPSILSDDRAIKSSQRQNNNGPPPAPPPQEHQYDSFETGDKNFNTSQEDHRPFSTQYRSNADQTLSTEGLCDSPYDESNNVKPAFSRGLPPPPPLSSNNNNNITFDEDDLHRASNNSKYESYGCRIDRTQGDKSNEIALFSFERPHMRAFHFAWISFFIAFFTWFAITPLQAEIKDTLDLSHEELWTSSICGIAGTVICRLIAGPICDSYGARWVMSITLIISCIPVMATGLVHTFVELCIVRLLTGIAGSAFVTCQYWTSTMFTREVSGTANSLVAGWGNVGGAVSNIFMGSAMFPLFKWMYGDTPGRSGEEDPEATAEIFERAWRSVLIIPAIPSIICAYALIRYSDDSPKGNYRKLKRLGFMPSVYVRQSFLSAANDKNTWILFIHYACSFGVELMITNAASIYFIEEFGQTTETGAAIASIFGWMNIFARGLGGFMSDMMNVKFGMKGRLAWQGLALVAEGVLLIVFGSAKSLGWSIASMAACSLFVQSAEGSTFSMVPYVHPRVNGSVAGIVAAGGNVGGVAFLVFIRQWGYDRAYNVVGIVVICSAALIFLISINGHAGFICGRDAPEVKSVMGNSNNNSNIPIPPKPDETDERGNDGDEEDGGNVDLDNDIHQNG